MSKRILFIFFSLLTCSAFPQTKYLVYFQDKGITREQFLLEFHSLQKSADHFLSPKSIERRKNSMGVSSYITFEDLPLNESYISSLKANGITIVHKLKWFNAASVFLSNEELSIVTNLPFINKVEVVKQLKSKLRNNFHYRDTDKGFYKITDSGYLFDYGPSFNQYMLSNIPPVHNLGISGQGVIIGMLDSGFRITHEAFNNMNIIAEWDFVNNDSSTANEPWKNPRAEGHGTFTLSLIGGFSEGNMVAPAFSSSYVLAKTEDVDMESHIEEDNFVAALEWMDSIGVNITSSSLGYGVFDDSTYSYTYEDMDGQTTIVTQACNLAFERGIVAVTSAGNGGLSSWFYITAPADAFKIIAVGAVTNYGYNTWWASRGPTFDGRLKPEICAQGEGYGISAEATGGFEISNGIWGTSGACPIAAGIISMLLSEFPHLNNEQVRSIVLQSGDNLIQPDSVRGYGILSAVKAISFPNLALVDGFFRLNKIFINEEETNKSNVLLHYSVGDNPYNEENMIYNGEHLYNFDFPLLFNPDTIKFYFTYIDTIGNMVREPAESYYKFLYGEKIIELDLINITSQIDRNQIVNQYCLEQNYPNPFNPITKINYSIPHLSSVTLKIFDILGNEIETLVDQEKSTGNFEVEWNATGLKSGIYFYRLRAGSFVDTKKMVLIK